MHFKWNLIENSETMSAAQEKNLKKIKFKWMKHDEHAATGGEKTLPTFN